MEDTPYRLVSPGEPVPTLKALDHHRSVVHLGSYSKTIFPGARVDFAVADQTVVCADGRTNLLADELSKIKSMVTVNTSSLSQAVVAGALLAAGGRISDLTAKAADHYGDAMRRVLDRLADRLPEPRRAQLGVRWNEPSGGFFLRLTVGFEADDLALARSAEKFGVVWTPMRYFHPDDGGRRVIRLSVSYLSPEEIDDGISRLVAFIDAETTRHRTLPSTT